MTNTEYAKTNQEFINACKAAKTEPTKRQASKYRRKMGKAWKERIKEYQKSDFK